MSAIEKYQQCRLTRRESERTAWIPVRGAKVGVQVELGGRGGELWTVSKVFSPVQSKADLDERERQTRGGVLPSVKVVRES